MTGCTVHFVDDEYDHGPIVAQAAVVVEDGDTPETLAHRVQDAERRIFPACIRLFQEGRLAIDGRRVRVLPAHDRPAGDSATTPERPDATTAGPVRESPAIAAAGPRLRMPAPRTTTAGRPVARGGPDAGVAPVIEEPSRARARALAHEALRVGRPTDWFERLYREAGHDARKVPWADLAPNAALFGWAGRPHALHHAVTAAVVGCGLGHDAEFLAAKGLDVTAFDISATAIEWAKRLHPGSAVRYEAQDLFALPADWRERFDLVVEVYTLQALPQSVRAAAAAAIRSLLAPNGTLFVFTRLRDDGPDAPPLVESDVAPPWPLGRHEFARMVEGLVPHDPLLEVPDVADPTFVRAHGTWRRPD